MSERSIFISSTEVPLLDAPIQPDWIVSGSRARGWRNCREAATEPRSR